MTPSEATTTRYCRDGAEVPVTRVDADDPTSLRTRVGDVLSDRYRLVRLLGHGGAGAVYEAADLHTGGRVAVKVLHEGLTGSREHVSRFLREARAMTSLEHPGIARVYEVCWDGGGSLYLVMELLRGEVMQAAMARGRLTDTRALDVGCQVLDALATAHAEGVVHRDVKPDNIFLTRDDGYLQVKLFDFGIARFTRSGSAGTFRSQHGLLIGTPHYMSPEACLGDETTPAVDLWAVGAVLYHSLAHEPPFHDASIGRLLTRIVTERAPSLAKRRPDLPEHVTHAVDRALQPDPRKRWPTAGDFRWALMLG